MTGIHQLIVIGAAIAAGALNTVVGSGTLITFPTLLALGLPPVTANVSNTIGLVPGSVTGVYGYRRELAGQRTRLRWLASASLLGSPIGAVLLLVLPPHDFTAAVPVLILAAVALVVIQPMLAAWVQRRRQAGGDTASPAAARSWLGWLAVLLTGVYGGYFGAAQGVLLLGVLGAFVDEHIQRVNAIKNLLGLVANGVSAVIFILVAHVSWQAAGLIAAGSLAGGWLGARVGRRLPPVVLRLVIVAVGTIAAIRQLATT